MPELQVQVLGNPMQYCVFHLLSQLARRPHHAFPRHRNLCQSVIPAEIGILELCINFAIGLASFAVLAAPAPASPTATDAADVYAAQATAKSTSPTSKVKGKAFDRYVSLWFENTDFEMAAGDRTSSASFQHCI